MALEGILVSEELGVVRSRSWMKSGAYQNCRKLVAMPSSWTSSSTTTSACFFAFVALDTLRLLALLVKGVGRWARTAVFFTLGGEVRRWAWWMDVIEEGAVRAASRGL